MSRPGYVPPASPAKAPPAVPRPRWWRKIVPTGDPKAPRVTVRWGRILAVICTFLLACYLSLATALWGYYAVYRKIPNVQWIDVVVLPRFSRVQSAIGSYFYAQAKDQWARKDYVRAIFTGRAAVMKAPDNLDARLFLAGCWQQAGRPREAVRALRDGIAFSATDPRLQQALVETCLADNNFGDLLTVLRTDFPAHGVRLLDGRNRVYQLAEVRAVLETSTAAEAERIAGQYPGLDSEPDASPLLAEIDWELGHQEAALSRLRKAHSANMADPSIDDVYIDMNLRLNRTDEARRAALGYLRQYPHLLTAQIRFLQAFGSRKGDDEKVWIEECIRFLNQYRRDPGALGQLGSLAASKGWTDITYLLYEISLQENMTGFPFVIYYVGSLVRAGDIATADEIWRDLAVRNSAEIAAAPYITAMIYWSTGRESDALQILDQLRRDTADDRHRHRVLDGVFRDFGFPKLANLFSGLPEGSSAAPAPSALPDL